MQTLTGVGVCAGRVIGELVSMPEPVSEPAAGLMLRDEEPEAAVARLHTAAAAVKAAFDQVAAAFDGTDEAPTPEPLPEPPVNPGIPEGEV